MRRYFHVTIFVTVLAGCSQPPAVVKPSGGYQVLRQECVALLQDYRRTKKEFWRREDKLPPAIASLRPQYVQICGEIAPPFVDIQTSGGFQHQGLLVVCDDAAKDYVPVKGRDWTVTKVADFVFAYRE